MVATHPRESTREGAASVYGRALLGWQQDDLASALTEETGERWTKQRVSRMERGDYRIRGYEAQALADVLGLPVQFILGGMEAAGLSPSPGQDPTKPPARTRSPQGRWHDDSIADLHVLPRIVADPPGQVAA